MNSSFRKDKYIDIDDRASTEWHFALCDRVVRTTADNNALIPLDIAAEAVAQRWGESNIVASGDDVDYYRLIAEGGEIEGREWNTHLPELPDTHPIVRDVEQVRIEKSDVDEGVFFV